LTKWELTKWEVDQMGIDEVGIDKVGIDKVGITRMALSYSKFSMRRVTHDTTCVQSNLKTFLNYGKVLVHNIMMQFSMNCSC